MNDQSEVREGFIRQRRNLMVVSLVLLFAETSELTIKKINVLGNELDISNPVAVVAALWLGYVYWLWRYFVYLHDIGEKGFVAAFNQRIAKLTEQLAVRQYVKGNHCAGMHVRASESAFIGMPSKNRIVMNVTIMVSDPKTGTGRPNTLPVAVEGRLLTFFFARATMHVLFRTRLFSEYAFPLFVATAPIAYMLHFLAARA